MLDGDNSAGVKVSSCNWSFVDKVETSSLLTTGSCDLGNWTSRTTTGTFVYNYISTTDKFTACNAAADDDKDGVVNGLDACIGTPANTTVDKRGCPALQGDTDLDGVIDANDICANTPAGSTVNRYGCPLSDPFLSNVCIGLNNKQGFARNDFSSDSLANLDYWNRPADKSPVYSSTIVNQELVVKCTKADTNYATMGFSFGQDKYNNLVPLDIRGNYKLKMKVNFQKDPNVTYTPTTVFLDVALEDVNGNSINSINALNARQTITLAANGTTWTNIDLDFKTGSLESYSAPACLAATGSSTVPCYIKNFDFSKVNKVKFVVNPSAGASWSRPKFTGTWKIDDFSLGYDATTAQACTAIRDDDGDGVKQERDQCQGTTPGSTVNTTGCSTSQLDTDKDGVANADDICPSTVTGATVNGKGCSAAQADDDGDGVFNDKDKCANTPAGAKIDALGCTVTGIDDEFVGQVNVYPVPATDNLTIEQNSLIFNKATLVNLMGTEVRQINISSLSETTSLQGLEKGLYILKLSGENKS